MFASTLQAIVITLTRLKLFWLCQHTDMVFSDASVKEKKIFLDTYTDFFDQLYDEIIKGSRNSLSGRSAVLPRSILSNSTTLKGLQKQE